MRATLEEFEEWLRERGYNTLMGEDNFKMFISLGFATLLFHNSNLLMSFILKKLGIPYSDRNIERIRFEIGKRIKSIKATKNELEIEI